MELAELPLNQALLKGNYAFSSAVSFMTINRRFLTVQDFSAVNVEHLAGDVAGVI